MSTARVIAVLIALVSTWTVPVNGQDAQGASSTGVAEALYDQAKARMKAGEHAKACALLEESQRLERGVGTALLLAHCYEALGRTASAWALFREVQSLAPDGSPRQQIARIRASALEPGLAMLVIDHPSATRPLHNDLQIRRDAVPVPTSALGTAVPVDPGRHTVTVSGTHVEPWSTTVDVSEGGLTRVAIPNLWSKKVRPSRGNPTFQPTSLVVAHKDEPPSHAVPWLLTGLGAASVLAGVTLSITAHSKYAQSDAHCRTRALCDTMGLEIRSNAETQAAWATGLSAVGAASLAAAGLLFVFDTGSNTAWHLQPSVTPRLASLSLGGTL